MAVNREARNLVADTLAAYMRGEIDNLALDKVIQDAPTDDDSLNRITFAIYFCYDDFKPHPVHVSQAGWEWFRRALAFLKTDLERPRAMRSHRELGWRYVLTWVAMLAWIAAVWAWWSSPFKLAIGWLVVGGIWILFVTRSTYDESDKRPHLTSYLPFESESQWKATEDLVESFHLPAYTEPAPQEPRAWTWVDRVKQAPGHIMLAVLAPLFMLLSLRPRRR